MSIRLRQICLVARELAPVVDDLKAVFGLEVCHIDPAVGVFGLENALLPVGNSFLEVVAPIRDGTAAGRYLDRRGGDGGYMVITQCDDVDRRKAHAEKLGVRIVHEMDYGDFRGIQHHPADVGGAIFETDWNVGGDDPEGPWHPAGDWRPAKRTEVVAAFAAVELQADDSAGLAARWSEVADLPLGQDAAGRPEIRFDNAGVRFVAATDGRGDGLGGVDLAVVDRDRLLAAAKARGAYVSDDRVDVCGTRFLLVDAP